MRLKLVKKEITYRRNDAARALGTRQFDSVLITLAFGVKMYFSRTLANSSFRSYFVAPLIEEQIENDIYGV